jgi:hypothetical protein
MGRDDRDLQARFRRPGTIPRGALMAVAAFATALFSEFGV